MLLPLLLSDHRSNKHVTKIVHRPPFSVAATRSLQFLVAIHTDPETELLKNHLEDDKVLRRAHERWIESVARTAGCSPQVSSLRVVYKHSVV
jgi:hypothetical protein